MRKGVEGLPLKYIAMLLIAALIVAAFVQVSNLMATTAANATVMSQGTLNNVLDQSLGNVIRNNVTP